MNTKIVKNPRTKKEYIAKRIQIIAEKKQKEIDATFQDILINRVELATNAKLRSKAEILAKYRQNSYMYIEDVFDIDSSIIDIGDKNKWISAKRNELKLQLSADVESLFESLWLGEADSGIIETLKVFELKVYK